MEIDGVVNEYDIISFTKNNVDRRELASHILQTCGLNDRASYYSGRGLPISNDVRRKIWKY